MKLRLDKDREEAYFLKLDILYLQQEFTLKMIADIKYLKFNHKLL